MKILLTLQQPMDREYYIKRLSRSLNREENQINRYLERKRQEGKEHDPAVVSMVELIRSESDQRFDQESNPEWHSDNLEADLRSTDWILAKAREREDYAQNLYAALCNNTFQRNDVVTILKNKTWSCSWRYAGGIVADMRQTGDYLDWYCTGIQIRSNEEISADKTAEQSKNWEEVISRYVSESVVTDEIREDLWRLGWTVVDTGDNDADL